MISKKLRLIIAKTKLHEKQMFIIRITLKYQRTFIGYQIDQIKISHLQYLLYFVWNINVSGYYLANKLLYDFQECYAIWFRATIGDKKQCRWHINAHTATYTSGLH